MAVLSHFSDGGRADASFGAQVLFLHILIDEQFPKLLITYRHNAFLPICKNALPLGRAFGLTQLYCQGSTTLNSVVYNDSTIMLKKQLYYIFAAKIMRSQHFCNVSSFQRKVLFLCLLRGRICLLAPIRKDLTFGSVQATIQPLSETGIAQLRNAVGRLIYTT